MPPPSKPVSAMNKKFAEMLDADFKNKDRRNPADVQLELSLFFFVAKVPDRVPNMQVEAETFLSRNDIMVLHEALAPVELTAETGGGLEVSYLNARAVELLGIMDAASTHMGVRAKSIVRGKEKADVIAYIAPTALKFEPWATTRIGVGKLCIELEIR